ncbi:MAG TPA: methionine synthase, partial [Streptosporangiaceae bacterium]|nr:methionine synthase [Streptosporangiaceae bacterium]
MTRVSSGEQKFPWPAASASGVGSWPGTDPREAIAVILGELPELPHLPELPGRGPGADMIGRTAGLLVDLPVQTTARGWRLGAKSGRDSGRASSYLSADLDAIEEAAAGYAGPFKIQACGPWTLAASLELTRSVEPALVDPGALADLTSSLAEGLAAHVAAVRSRLPAATILLQLDEPALPAVLAGSVPTASGLHRLPPVDDLIAADHL